MGVNHSKDLDKFFKAILALKSVDECYDFFEDVCTIREMQDLSQRFDVARLLSSGDVYNEVVKKTGASTATISRVNKCLMYGSGGYKMILKRLKEEKK